MNYAFVAWLDLDKILLWYRLFTKRGMQYSQSGSRIQDTNIAALMSLSYTMSVPMQIKVSSLKLNFGYR